MKLNYSALRTRMCVLYSCTFYKLQLYMNVQIQPLTPDWIVGAVTDLLSVVADCFPHLSFRCGLQVAQTVAESLSSKAELPMLLLDGGHTLEHHLIILPVGRVKMAVRTKILILLLYKCFPRICCAPIMSQTEL